MSTLAVVEKILHETMVPMTVREIVERAGTQLPSKSKTPETVVARDLAMDIKKHGEGSLFVRTSPGRYTLRAATASSPAEEVAPVTSEPELERIGGGALARKPAVAAGTSRPVSGRDSAEGGGYAG